MRIETVRGRTPEQKRALLEGVHSALVEAFRIPEDDRTLRLVEHEPEDFVLPPGSSAAFTLVEITAFPGRSAEAKRALYEAIVRNLADGGVPPDEVKIVIQEPPLQNWGIRGGTPADQVDLGFSLDV